ncbi:CLUMA_CG011063, isoform A [Clunio marinus]|uniref:arginine kinase n=1 Tax=Clunio marinus TaxID=568069 RepID=A0A1J1IBV5_9DIPT|nr:CLUMA_CG011063, isoform A [Clunio marinus]
MDINCIGIESKRDGFRKYLESTGMTEKLTTALMKLYQEEERPVDAVGYVKNFLSPGDSENCITPEKFEALQAEVEKVTKERDRLTLDLAEAKGSIKKSASEIDLALTNLFRDFDEDESGKSMLKEYLTEELFLKLKGLRTDLRGYLLDNIQSGLTHYDQEIGIFASDQYAYVTFGELFNQVLEDLHNVETPEADEVEGEDSELPKPIAQPDVDWGDAEELNDLDPEGLFIKSISISVSRSFHGIPFMPTIPLNKLKEIAENLNKILVTITDEEFQGKYFDLAEIDKEMKEKWIQEGILFPNPDDKYLKAAETYRFWPLQRGMFLNDKENFRVWVNEEEHLKITAFEDGSNLREVFKRLVKSLEYFNDLKFARDERWGFVTHNLKNIGNTLQITVKAKIPKLSLPENSEQLDAFATGNDIAFKDLGLGLLELTSKKRMGITEIETAKAFQKGIAEMITAEKCLYA